MPPLPLAYHPRSKRYRDDLLERLVRAQAKALAASRSRWLLSRVWGRWLTGHAYEHGVRTVTFVLAVLAPIAVLSVRDLRTYPWLAAVAITLEFFLVVAAVQGADPRSAWYRSVDKLVTFFGRSMMSALILLAVAMGAMAVWSAWLNRAGDAIVMGTLAAVAALMSSMFLEPLYTSSGHRPSFLLAVAGERAMGVLLVVVLVPVSLRLAHSADVVGLDDVLAIGIATSTALLGLLAFRLRRQRRVVTEAVTSADELASHVASGSSTVDVLLASARLERALGTALVGWGRTTATCLAAPDVRTALLYYAHRITHTAPPASHSEAISCLRADLHLLPEGTVREELVHFCRKVRADLGPWVDVVA